MQCNSSEQSINQLRSQFTTASKQKRASTQIQQHLLTFPEAEIAGKNAALKHNAAQHKHSANSALNSFNFIWEMPQKSIE
jgi:hypothetical protein